MILELGLGLKFENITYTEFCNEFYIEESLNTLNSPIKEALCKKKLWSAVKEDLQLKQLPEGLKEFIIHYVKTDHASISVLFDNDLFYKTHSLIDAVKKLWRMPKLQSCFAKYNESSWSHYVLQQMVNFIADYKEIVESENHSDLELLLGEISNGPFNQSAKAQKHMKEDKIKLSKSPFSRLRKLAILEIPFINGSTQELIRLIQVN
ncbi:14172_t:CDS:2 [Gigaspora margarita]|uniref:14172_t:CDS:1 n=1 Tax=Gigaspora margarita TaxID=4874 RepID=A0ABM8W1H4_GIGMA|nr:14172_t:CDS:2 [Gigaspora margarita]